MLHKLHPLHMVTRIISHAKWSFAISPYRKKSLGHKYDPKVGSLPGFVPISLSLIKLDITKSTVSSSPKLMIFFPTDGSNNHFNDFINDSLHPFSHGASADSLKDHFKPLSQNSKFLTTPYFTVQLLIGCKRLNSSVRI